MRHTTLAAAALSLAILAGCGGGSPSAGDQSPKVKFSAQVSFGDSLSDVGTYAVGGIKAAGGGHYTINGNNTGVNETLTGKNWTELTATQFGLPAPCAAQTGLDGNAALGFSVPVANHAGCYGYAQGGSRVSDPVGLANKLTGSPLGQLTVPVAQQIKNHLAAVGGKFKGDEIVLVMAGANDLFIQLALLSSDATAEGTKAGATAFGTTLAGLLAAGASNPAVAAQAIGLALATESARPGHTDASVVGAAVAAAAVQPGNAAVAAPAVYGPLVAKAQAAATAAGAKAGADYAAANGARAVKAMGVAAAELANLVKNQIVGNGARYVVVNNMPDVATTPFGMGKSADVQALINAMVKTFNEQLAAGIANDANVLQVDVFAASHDQATNPGPYGLSNVTTPACDLTPSKNALGSSLICNAGNLVAGDVSHYSFADELHPTPFVNLLLARYVSKYMVAKGWL
ncbi:MAG: SGNH/GDSL hydrolase family protein [Pseudomonadota bacterium]